MRENDSDGEGGWPQPQGTSARGLRATRTATRARPRGRAGPGRTRLPRQRTATRTPSPSAPRPAPGDGRALRQPGYGNQDGYGNRTWYGSQDSYGTQGTAASRLRPGRYQGQGGGGDTRESPGRRRFRLARVAAARYPAAASRAAAGASWSTSPSPRSRRASAPGRPSRSATTARPRRPGSPPRDVPGPHNNASGSGSSAAPLNPAAVQKKVDPGLVDIVSTLKYNSETAEGTGMIISATGLVLTNNHVIDGATTVQATLVDREGHGLLLGQGRRLRRH